VQQSIIRHLAQLMLEKVQELVKYLARPESDEGRATFIRPFQDALITPEGEATLGEDEEKRRKVLKLVLAEIKGLGEGSDRGAFKISSS
jgi:translation initiation factor 3 subunit M